MNPFLKSLLVFVLLAAAGFAADFAETKKKAEAGDATPTSLSNDTKPPSLRQGGGGIRFQGGGGIRFLEDTTGPQSGWFELFNGTVEARELIRGEKVSMDGGLEFEYDISKDTYILYEKSDHGTKWEAVPLKKKWFRAEFTNDKSGKTLRFYSKYWEYHVVDESTSIHLECKGESGAVAVFTHRLQKNNLLSDL